MLSSGASIPARRAARVAIQARTTAHQPLYSQALRQCQPQQQRQYAMRAPSLTRRQNVRPAPAAAGTLLFKDVPIPSVNLWQDFKTHRELGDLTPQDGHRTATTYINLATQSSSTWKGALQRDHNIDPYTLHYAALPLVSDSSKNLGLHMLMTASSLGYVPSTLSLVSLLVHGNKTNLSSLGRDLEARFKQLVQTGKNPDALTLQGLLFFRDAKPGSPNTYALRYLDRAIEAASDLPPPPATTTDNNKPEPLRAPRWSYEATCHHHRGLILLHQNRTDEAKASFRIAAEELNFADACAELAKLLPQDAQERWVYLEKAAQAGVFEASRLLALIATRKVADPDLPLRERGYFVRVGAEWAGMVPDVDEQRAVLDEISKNVDAIKMELAKSSLGGAALRLRNMMKKAKIR